MKLTASSVLDDWKKRILGAKEDITIFAPYWDELLIDLLDHCRTINKQLGGKSVPVTIVTTDNPTNYLISSSAFAALEKAHKDFLVKVLPNLHAKSMIVDGNIVSCGSQNFTHNSHNNMKELSILFEDHSSKTIEGWEEARTTLRQWEKRARKIDDSLIEELRERIKGYQDVEKTARSQRVEKSKRQLKEAAEREKSYNVKIQNNSLVLTEPNITYPHILARKRAQGDRSDWMTLIDSNNDNQLIFVRMNNQSITYCYYKMTGTIRSPTNSKTVYDYEMCSDYRNKNTNLVIHISGCFKSQTYTASLQLCYYGGKPTFVEWRKNIVKWENGRSIELMRYDVDYLISRGDLMNSIFETFKPQPVFGKDVKKIGLCLSPQSKTVKLLKYGKYPIWYLS